MGLHFPHRLPIVPSPVLPPEPSDPICGEVTGAHTLMPRIARVVAPDVPHHVTQRGNHRQETFFGPGDYKAYLGLLAEWAPKCGVSVWSYCLMPNHVHLIVVPSQVDGLAHFMAEVQRRYTRRVNFREGWQGYLWQGRYFSCPLQETHLISAVRYVLRNPVRAGLVKRPEHWRWSSARAHLKGIPDPVLAAERLNSEITDWKELLSADPVPQEVVGIRRHTHSGRPYGSEAFVQRIGEHLHRPLNPGRPGRKPAPGGAS